MTKLRPRFCVSTPVLYHRKEICCPLTFLHLSHKKLRFAHGEWPTSVREELENRLVGKADREKLHRTKTLFGPGKRRCLVSLR